MRVSDFHFDLPEELIAQHPPAERGSSRMLVAQRQSAPQPLLLTDSRFSDLPAWLRPGDLLVLNDSRVLPSRLFATRAGATTHPRSPTPSGKIEVLLTERLEAPEPGVAFSDNVWRALCRPAKKVVPGERLLFHDPASPPHSAPLLSAEVVSLGCFGERTLRFGPVPPGGPDFYGIVSRIGHMPLPPYIHRDQRHASSQDEAEDNARYQTVYAQDPRVAPPASAAAPTAGLHFTPQILDALHTRGVQTAYLTLHVGLGTFQPVRVPELAQIQLHAERYTLSAETAAAISMALHDRRRIIAVGTTTTRTLEHVAQLAHAGGEGRILPHSGSTSIFLSPGHRFRVVSGLLTNFHLPESTLIMLVSALAANTPLPASAAAFEVADPDAGRRNILAAYAHAVRNRYRFFSYGDCMLIL